MKANWETSRGAQIEIHVEGKEIIGVRVNGREYTGKWGLCSSGHTVEIYMDGRKTAAIIPSNIYNQIKKQFNLPKESEQTLRKRLQEISVEAENAKSDTVLMALKAERAAIVKQIGVRCEGCGKYHLPEELKHGVCHACYITGNAW